MVCISTLKASPPIRASMRLSVSLPRAAAGAIVGMPDPPFSDEDTKGVGEGVFQWSSPSQCSSAILDVLPSSETSTSFSLSSKGAVNLSWDFFLAAAIPCKRTDERPSHSYHSHCFHPHLHFCFFGRLAVFPRDLLLLVSSAIESSTS